MTVTALQPGRIPAGRGPKTARPAFVEQPAGRHLDQATEWISGTERAGVSKFFSESSNRFAGWKPLATERPGATGTGPGRVLDHHGKRSLTLLGRTPELPCDAVLDPANGKRSMSPFAAGPAGDPAVAGHARLDCPPRWPSGS